MLLHTNMSPRTRFKMKARSAARGLRKKAALENATGPDGSWAVPVMLKRGSAVDRGKMLRGAPVRGTNAGLVAR